MATVRGPLLSFDATGKIGDAAVFSHAKGGINTVRGYKIPANPNTAAQQAQRSLTSKLNILWKALSQDVRDSWNLLASLSGKPVSGWNMFYSEGVARYQADPAAAMVATLTVTPGTDKLTLECTLRKIADASLLSSATNVYGVAGASPTNPGTPVNLPWVGGSSSYTADITGLTTDVLYYAWVVDTAPPANLSGYITGTPT